MSSRPRGVQFDGWGRRPEGRGGGADLDTLLALRRDVADPVR